jgi:hypothetical protein
MVINMLSITHMCGRPTIRRLIQAAVAYVAVWLVCFVEFINCGTAWGGPFTILVSFILNFAFAGLAVMVALAIGSLLLIPGVRDLWKGFRYWSLLLSATALAVMILASRLGLRTVDPVSNYRIMPFGIWCACLIGIAFPIVNLPIKRASDA